MLEIKFHPNLTDPKVVLGVVYMTSCYNVHEVVNVVNRYLDCNPNDQLVYDYFVQMVSYRCRENTFHFLASMFSNVSKGYNNFLRRLLNEPSVINSIKLSRIRIVDKDDIRIIAKSFVDVFDCNSVLDILRSKVSRSVFVVFGYHPAIVHDVELQRKWIKVVAEEPLYVVREVPWYITNKALESAAQTDLDKVIVFIEEFFGNEHHKKKKIALFNGDTLKKIIALYIVSGDSARGRSILSKVKAYEKHGLLGTPNLVIPPSL